jgi:hypothetical protein
MAGAAGAAQLDAALDALLVAALDDGALYSALVPWSTSQHGTLALSEWALQRPQLHPYARAAGAAGPAALRARVLALAHRHCLDEARWGACGAADAAAGAPCELPPRAARLAKLHGHLLSHGLLAAPLDEVCLLLDMLWQAPTPAAVASSGRACRTKGQLAQKQEPRCAAPSCAVLLPCSCAVARYAAKALECCGRLLAGLEPQLIQQLACSAHLAGFAPQLAQSLARAAAAPPVADGLASAQQEQGERATAAASGTGQQAREARPVYSPAKHAAPTALSGGATGARRRLVISAVGPPSPSAASSGPDAASSAGSGAVVRPAVSAVGLLKPSGSRRGDASCATTSVDAALIANRERGRDSFFAALRDVTARLAAARQAQQERQAAAAAASGEPHPGKQPAAVAGRAAGSSGAQPAPALELEEVLLSASNAMGRLLAALTPEGLWHVAELFTACVLQAASTGEALVEPRLVVLAEKDPGRFLKLQQRLNRSGDGGSGGGGGSGAGGVSSAGVAARRAGGLPAATALRVSGSGSGSSMAPVALGGGGPNKGAGSSQPRPLGPQTALEAAPATHSFGGRPHGGGRGSGPGLAPAFAGAAACAQLLRDFPLAQHPFVCLIEAADSARLNGALLRVMAARAARLMAPPAGRPMMADALGLQCRSAVALGRYMGHLAFSCGAAGASEALDGQGCCDRGSADVLSQLPPFELLPLLERASRSAWGLALAVPFACSCLSSLSRTSAGLAAAPSVRAALLWLRRVQADPALRPQGAGFGQLAMCLTASIEGLFHDLEAAGVAPCQLEDAAADVAPGSGTLVQTQPPRWQQQEQQQQQQQQQQEQQQQQQQRQQQEQQEQEQGQRQKQQQQQQQQEGIASHGASQGAAQTPIPFAFHQQQQQQQAGEFSTGSSRAASQQLSQGWWADSSQQQWRAQQQQQHCAPGNADSGPTPLGLQSPVAPGSACGSNTAASVPRTVAGAAADAATPPPSVPGPASSASSRRRELTPSTAAAAPRGGLAEVLGAGSGLVDGLYWSLVCPAHARLTARLGDMQQHRQQQPVHAEMARRGASSERSRAGPQGPQGGASQEGGQGASRQRNLMAAPSSAAPGASGASSPGGSIGSTASSAAGGTAAAAVRRRLTAVPTLAAPRAPPKPAEAPAALRAALEPDPVRHQLQVALLQQYSPDEQPVNGAQPHLLVLHLGWGLRVRAAQQRGHIQGRLPE